jgi:hypothetical protein
MYATLLASLAIGQAAPSSAVGWGLLHAEFPTPAGKVIVYLPDDIRAGDTVSGTVVTAPLQEGADPNTLAGVVVEFAGAKSTGGAFVATVGAAGMAVLALRDSEGRTLGRQLIAVGNPTTRPTGADFPPVAQSGRPVWVGGPFDGDATNTSCSVRGRPVTVVAESPRSAVALPPEGLSGRVKIQVQDGPFAAEGDVNVAELRMSAPKSQLLQGERTTLTVRVTGLEGLPESAYPVPLELTNQTPGTVVLEGGNPGGARCVPVEFGAVRDGQWSRSFGLTGVSPGAYGIKGVFFWVGIHQMKMGLDADELGALIDANLAQVDARLERMRKEKASDWAMNLVRKQRETLAGAREALPDLDNARTLYDKAMADMAFFEMAAGLVDFAAEMLGYKDIPLPGVGTVIKGLKAVAKGSAKALELLEKAEKIHETLEKIEDAKEKAKKAKEAADLIKGVKEALSK